MTENRIAELKYTNELLVQMLHLPEDTKIIGVKRDDPRYVTIYVAHRDLKPQGEASIEMAYPKLRQHFCDTPGFEKVTFEGWGQW